MPVISFDEECKPVNGDKWGCPRSGKCRSLVGSLMDMAAKGENGVSSLFIYNQDYKNEEKPIKEAMKKCNHLWVMHERENMEVET